MARIGGKGMTREQYIVKNCPAQPIIWNNNWCNKKQQFCQNCTDCVIKQVIEKCKGAVFNYSNLEILRTACETNQAYGKANIAEQILQLFGIEEINK